MRNLILIVAAVLAILTFSFFFLASEKSEEPKLGKLNLHTEDSKVPAKQELQKKAPPKEEKPKMPLELKNAKSFYIGGATSAEYDFDTDLKGGVLKAYYENGDLFFEVRLLEGQFHGAYKSYYPGGAILEIAHYRVGQLEGASEIYYKSGKLLGEFFYRQSVLAYAPKLYSEDTSLSDHMKLESKEKKGYFKAYDDKGRLINEWNFQGGEGGSSLHKTTFDSGGISAEWSFDESALTGFIKIYYETGDVWFEAKYHQGAVFKQLTKSYPNGDVWSEEIYSEEGIKKLTHYYYPSGFKWFTVDHDTSETNLYPKLQSELKVSVTVIE